ncbi:MAG: hypothetical protein DME93_09385 [Verrucomicrobia bacterium]|nr:MAG: hypothetical protein DME93_09385 [Verrucomicrobiota bacterium]
MHVRRQALLSDNFVAERSERVALSNCHSISASAKAAPFGLFSLLSLSEKGAEIDANHLRNGRNLSYGYRIEWFIGDHAPRHVHVYDTKERFLGRLNIETMQGIED